MPKIQYDMLTRNGKDQFVVVPLRDYEDMLEGLQDGEDFSVIEASKNRNAGKALIPHEQVKREFGHSSQRKKRKS
jgi:hypothetical protein